LNCRSDAPCTSGVGHQYEDLGSFRISLKILHGGQPDQRALTRTLGSENREMVSPQHRGYARFENVRRLRQAESRTDIFQFDLQVSHCFSNFLYNSIASD
jgi:hypothetical protein